MRSGEGTARVGTAALARPGSTKGQNSARASIALVILLTGSTGCARLVCDDRVLGSAMSPDGILTAYAVERNCGATAPFARSLYVQPTRERADRDQGTLFVVEGRPRMDVKWKANRQLVIVCPGCARGDTFKKVVELGDIDVSYE